MGNSRPAPGFRFAAQGAALFGRLNFVVPEGPDLDTLIEALSRWAYENRAAKERLRVRICCLSRLEESGKLWQVEREFGAKR